MKKIILITAVFAYCIMVAAYSFSQGTSINSSGASAHGSAILDVSSTTQGQLIPRMTTAQRNAINSPAEGLLIYNISSQCYEGYNSATNQWVSFGCIGCQLPGTFAATAATNTGQTSFTANWNASAGATSYYLDVATDAGFTSFVSGYNNLNVGNVQTQGIASLQCETTYYYRVRAYNTCGTSPNSNTISAVTSSCGPSCGSQVWATANLNVGSMISGQPVGQRMYAPGGDEKFCYNNLEANCTTYGGMYEWGEAMKYNSGVNCDPCGSSGVQGICPDGYHIPTDLEWSRYEYCIENNIAPTGSTPLSTFQNNMDWRGSAAAGVGPGSKMKVTSGYSPSWDGTNTSGFTAVPGGDRAAVDGQFYSLGSNAYFWSATEYSGSEALLAHVTSANAQSYRSYRNKTSGYSIRCLKN